MNNDINLVSPRTGQLEKEQKQLRYVRIIAFATMFTVAVIAILVFIINLTLPINSLKQEEAATLASISALHKKLVQYILVQDRTRYLANLIPKRQKLPSLVKLILDAVPQELSITSMSVSEKNISLVVSGGSLLPMNKLIDNVTILGKQKNVLKNLVVQQLSVDVKSGKYSISIQASIK